MYDSNHEETLRNICESNITLKAYLDGLSSFAKNSDGNTVLIGLNKQETIDFLSLYYIAELAIKTDHEIFRANPNNKPLWERFQLLLEKHNTAASKDAAENYKFRNDGGTTQ